MVRTQQTSSTSIPAAGKSRTFQFAPGPNRILRALLAFTSTRGTLTLSDDQGQRVRQVVTPGTIPAHPDRVDAEVNQSKSELYCWLGAGYR